MAGPPRSASAGGRVRFEGRDLPDGRGNLPDEINQKAPRNAGVDNEQNRQSIRDIIEWSHDAEVTSDIGDGSRADPFIYEPPPIVVVVSWLLGAGWGTGFGTSAGRLLGTEAAGVSGTISGEENRVEGVGPMADTAKGCDGQATSIRPMSTTPSEPDQLTAK